MTTISQLPYPVKYTVDSSKKNPLINIPSNKQEYPQSNQRPQFSLINANTGQALKALTLQNTLANNCKTDDLKYLILNMLEARHPQTKQHSIGVAIYAKELAKELKLPDEKVNEIETGALFHDIGKISLPDDFFNQKNLTPGIVFLCKNHPENGANILSKIASLSKPIINIAKYHHEKYDGTGYPNGLKGEEIPLETRIVSIADAFDSMTRKKYPNQKVKTFEEAIKAIKENKSGQWDPALTEPFIDCVTRK